MCTVRTRPEHPDRGRVAACGHRGDALVRVPGGERAREEAEQLGHLFREVVGAEHARSAAERGGRDRVGARRPPDPEVDATGVERLEHAELFGDRERSVVGQHDPAGAEPDGVGDTARCASSTGGDELAIPGMLWCSATQ